MLTVRYAVEHPEQISHLILISPQCAQPLPADFETRFAPRIRADFEGHLRALGRATVSEPHSLKAVEDTVAYGLGTTPELVIESLRGLAQENTHDLLARVSSPTLVLHGTRDKIVRYAHGREIAESIPGARLVTFEGGGHTLPGREVPKVNRLIRDFALGRDVEAQTFAPTTERKAPPLPRPNRSAQRRILWLSSAIGLGHIERDIAIARKIREIHPDATVDFLAGEPTRRVVESMGERVHPATELLLDETHPLEDFAQTHELNASNALWSMDEVFAANFMTFADVIERERYDLWVSDEGWGLDYYLHENPELKRAPYVFLTDCIGYLPMCEDPGSTEFLRCWEKNAENIDHLRLHPDVRDLSVLVGDEEDVLDRPFGPDLPNMRAWAREHFRFPGYTYSFDPAAYRDRQALRRRLGYRDGERVILASAGGTRVGENLLRKCAEAFGRVADQIPEARMVLVTGPRLDPGDLPRHPRIEHRAFVPRLFEHHAAADLAIVQGGLATTMELAAFRTPFVYFPLRNHFEQQIHVVHRLERLGAGVRMDYDRTDAKELGAAILGHLGQPALWREPPTGGTERAAQMIAALL